jgi:hypothetical protein
MKIIYTCDRCGSGIDNIEIENVDEERFGFDLLTVDERQEIIKVDSVTNSMYVQSLCDACIEELGLADGSPVLSKGYLH